MPLTDLNSIYSNIIKIGPRDNLKDQDIGSQYNKFELREASHNPDYIKHPLMLSGIQKGGETEPPRNSFLENSLPVKVAKDAVRMSKYLISADGLLFNAKQVGLQLSNPMVEKNPNLVTLGRRTRVYNPVNLLASVGGSPLGLHFKRHGLLPIGDIGNYSNVVKKLNTPEYIDAIKNITNPALLKVMPGNRLIKLRNELLLKDGNYINPTGLKTNLFTNYKEFFTSKSEVTGLPIATLSGLAGPNSLYGIGTTTIRLSSYKTPALYKDQFSEESRYSSFNSNKIRNPIDETWESNISEQRKDTSFPKHNVDVKGDIDNYSVLAYGKLQRSDTRDFRKNIEDKKITGPDQDYIGLSPSGKFGMQDAGKIGIDKSDIKKSLSSDEINLLDIGQDLTDKRDYIKFYFNTIDGNNLLIFRATLSGMSDNFAPGWDSVQMLGRADSVYIYKSFERTFNFSFKVATNSRSELIQNYKKLNELAGYTAPTYLNNGMKSPFMKLTIGDYFVNTPCFITSLTFSPDDESPWEINLYDDDDIAQVPHIISVDISVNIINEYMPQQHGKFFSLQQIKEI